MAYRNLRDKMIERDESQIKREMRWWGIISKNEDMGVKDRDTTE